MLNIQKLINKKDCFFIPNIEHYTSPPAINYKFPKSENVSHFNSKKALHSVAPLSANSHHAKQRYLFVIQKFT